MKRNQNVELDYTIPELMKLFTILCNNSNLILRYITTPCPGVLNKKRNLKLLILHPILILRINSKIFYYKLSLHLLSILIYNDVTEKLHSYFMANE